MKAVVTLLLTPGFGLITLTAVASIPTTMTIQRAVQIAWQAEPDYVYQVQSSP